MTGVPVPPRTSTLDGIRGELLAAVDPVAPDERLLTELAASAASLAFEVETAGAGLARVLPHVLDDARKALAVARVLHDLASIGNVLVRRVEGALTTASTLRLQRRVHQRAGR